RNTCVLPAALVALIGCARERPSEVAEIRQRIDRNTNTRGYFDLQMSAQSLGMPPRPAGQFLTTVTRLHELRIAGATGSIEAPFVSGGVHRTEHVAHDGITEDIEVWSTCGATMISPSFV